MFKGSWREQMSGFTSSESFVELGIVTSLTMSSESIWRRIAFDKRTPMA